MKVKELIEELRKFNPEAEVIMVDASRDEHPSEYKHFELNYAFDTKDTVIIEL